MVVEQVKFLQVRQHSKFRWNRTKLIRREIKVDQVTQLGDVGREDVKLVMIDIEGRDVIELEQRRRQILQPHASHVEGRTDEDKR